MDVHAAAFFIVVDTSGRASVEADMFATRAPLPNSALPTLPVEHPWQSHVHVCDWRYRFAVLVQFLTCFCSVQALR